MFFLSLKHIHSIETTKHFILKLIYDKHDDFDFEIVDFPFLDGDDPRSTSFEVYISHLIQFARASGHVAYYNTWNKLFTQKLLKQGYRYHKLRKTFPKFYIQYYDLISKFHVGLKSLWRQGLSEPEFYGDLVYKLKKIVGFCCLLNRCNIISIPANLLSLNPTCPPVLCFSICHT